MPLPTTPGRKAMVKGAPDYSWQSYAAMSTTANVELKPAVGAGGRNYVTDLVISNSGITATSITIKDGTTTILRTSIPAMSMLAHSFQTPLRGSDNTAINGALGAVGNVDVTLVGYEAV